MIEKRFKVYAEEYQDTDDMGYAIAPPVIYYHAGNSKMGFNFNTEKEAKRLCEAWNKLVEENEQLKTQIKIFEEFLKGNDLDFEWSAFCTVEECPYNDEDFENGHDCQYCKNIKW